MKKILSFVVIGFALAAMGCSSTPVKLDYDPETDFGRYGTYDWLDDRPNIPDNVRDAMTRFPAIDEPLRKAVAAGLAAKGLTEDLEDPDVLVAYHIGVEDPIDLTGWGYVYSDPKAGWSRGMDTVAYRKGTLVLDVIDARTMHLVWRASARRAIDDDPSQSGAGGRIAGAVNEMLQTFPVE